jgi:hypothetical protein
MIIALEIQALSFFISSLLPEHGLMLLNLGASAWMVWNPLYYYMLIEQNTYWMNPKVKKGLHISWVLFIVWVIIVGTVCLLVGASVLPFEVIIIVQYLDFLALIYLSITEAYINIKIYGYSKAKLKSVSPSLWKKVKFSLSVFSFCIGLDLAILLFEQFGNSTFAYEVKTCSFAFKVVFECMCFQFIKGIVVSIE